MINNKIYNEIIPKEISVVKKKSTGFLADFKKFALKGNVIELAVGVIIGAAFNGVVNSLVKDIVTPPIGLLTGKVDFSNLYWNLSKTSYSTLQAAEAAGAPIIRYGQFINTLVQFLITALVIFILIKQITRFTEKDKKEEKGALPDTKECPFCFSEINKKAKRCPECTSLLDKKLARNI